MSIPPPSTYTGNIQLTGMSVLLANITIPGTDIKDPKKNTLFTSPILVYNPPPMQSGQITYYRSTNNPTPNSFTTTVFNFNIPCQLSYGGSGTANIDITYSPLYPDPYTRGSMMNPVNFILKSITIPGVTGVTFKVTSGSMSLGKGYYDNGASAAMNSGNINLITSP